jgi:hypothetical protein
MSQKIILIVDAGTTPQRDAITKYFESNEWLTWHYVDDAWITTGVPDNVAPREIWSALIENPVLRAIRGIIFKVNGDPTYWGGNTEESWRWLAQNFGQADFPKPQPVQPTTESAEPADGG